jgi:D,D-heptose 1,7-bisphosphate phosphatase
VIVDLQGPSVQQALILAGGRGTRLHDLTACTPKPLLEVGGRPFLDYILENVWRHGFRDVVLLGGFQASKLRHWAAKARWPGLAIKLVVEEDPAGTAGALFGAAELLDDEFLLLNGDSFFDINLLDLATATFDSDWTAAVALCERSDSSRYGVVELAGDRVCNFTERPTTEGCRIVNGGVYRVKRRLIEMVMHRPCSIERDIFPQLAICDLLVGRVYNRPLLDIGVQEAFHDAQSIMPSLVGRGALFLDRDGVLNRDVGYAHRPDQIEWGEGVSEAVKFANDAGYLVFVVTNQAGVARGLYDEGQVHHLHEWMNEQLRRTGAHIDEFVYCPFHPTQGRGHYRRDADCRKPKPGMILDLIERWAVDPSRCVLIGDKEIDMQAAASAGIRGVLYAGGSLAMLVRGVLG